MVGVATNPVVAYPYLVNGTGFTLYTFGPDTVGTSSSPPVAACGTALGCIYVWPAFYASNVTVEPGSGLNASDFTTFTNALGKPQTAYMGHPLYYYVGDTQPGAFTGADILLNGGPWYAAPASFGPVTAVSCDGGPCSLSVDSVNSLGNTLTGYWTELYSSNGSVLGTGYTPTTYAVTSGTYYLVEADGYTVCTFSHWEGDGLNGITTDPLPISITTTPTTLTAVYSGSGCGAQTTTSTSASTTTSGSANTAGLVQGSVLSNYLGVVGVAGFALYRPRLRAARRVRGA
jgi:predicted lipoprotein with Yx(FWY)xxD motif